MKSLRILPLLLMTLPQLAHAQGGGGHGGGAFVCATRKESELLDLWEATYFDELRIERTETAVTDQVFAAMKRLNELNPELGQRVQDRLNLIYTADGPNHETVEAVKEGGYLPFPSDTRKPTDRHGSRLKEGCTPRGVGDYYDELKKLFVDFRVLAQLPNTDQAAFWIHEAVYKTLRDINKDTDSVQARLYVGKIFSNVEAIKPLSIVVDSGRPTNGVVSSLSTDGVSRVRHLTYSTGYQKLRFFLPAHTMDFEDPTSALLVKRIQDPTYDRSFGYEAGCRDGGRPKDFFFQTDLPAPEGYSSYMQAERTVDCTYHDGELAFFSWNIRIQAQEHRDRTSEPYSEVASARYWNVGVGQTEHYFPIRSLKAISGSTLAGRTKQKAACWVRFDHLAGPYGVEYHLRYQSGSEAFAHRFSNSALKKKPDWFDQHASKSIEAGSLVLSRDGSGKLTSVKFDHNGAECKFAREQEK